MVKRKTPLTNERWPTSSDVVKDTLLGLGKITDVKETLREFNALQYEKPREYTSADIVRLRSKKMKMSQAVFAAICNVKLPTLQKWERGYSHPTPPINRLFQLIEHNALSLIRKQT